MKCSILTATFVLLAIGQSNALLGGGLTGLLGLGGNGGLSGGLTGGLRGSGGLGLGGLTGSLGVGGNGGIIGGLGGNLNGLVGGLTGAAGNVASGLAGTAENLVGGAVGGVGSLANGIAGAAGSIVNGIASGNIAGGVTGAAANLLNGAANAAGNVAGGVTGAAANLVSGAANAAGNVVGAAGNLVGGAVQLVANLLGSLGNVILSVLNGSPNGIQDFLNIFAEGLAYAGVNVQDAARNIKLALLNLEKVGINSVPLDFKINQNIGQAIQNAARGDLVGIQNLIAIIRERLIAAGVAPAEVQAKLKAALNIIISNVNNNSVNLENLVQQAFSNVANGVGMAANGVVNAAGNLANGVVNTAGNLAGGVAGAAGNLANGAVNAAANVVGGVANAAGSIVGGAANLIGNILAGGLGNIQNGGQILLQAAQNVANAVNSFGSNAVQGAFQINQSIEQAIQGAARGDQIAIQNLIAIIRERLIAAGVAQGDIQAKLIEALNSIVSNSGNINIIYQQLLSNSQGGSSLSGNGQVGGNVQGQINGASSSVNGGTQIIYQTQEVGPTFDYSSLPTSMTYQQY